jgi:hypothetical protein
MSKTELDVMAVHIAVGARQTKQRTGQYLFNHLPVEVGNKVAGTLFDPFHKDLSKPEIIEWLDNHLIFNENKIIALFDQNTILWTWEPPDIAVPALVRS